MKRAYLILAVLTVLAYARVWSVPFVYDDMNWLPVWHVTQWGRLPWIAMTCLGGGQTFGYHAGILGLHLFNGAILMTLLRRCLSPLSTIAGTGLFLLHPIQVESVAYMSGGMEVLLATYALLALWGASQGHWRGYGLSILMLLALALTKASALPLVVVLPFVMVLLARSWRLGVIIGGCAGVMALFDWPTVAVSLSEMQAHLQTLTLAVWRYLFMVVYPGGFSIEHDWTQTPNWVAILGMVAMLLVGYFSFRQQAWSVFVAWLIITALFVPRVFAKFPPPLMEHHTYVPFLAIWTLIAAGVGHCERRFA